MFFTFVIPCFFAFYTALIFAFCLSFTLVFGAWTSLAFWVAAFVLLLSVWQFTYAKTFHNYSGLYGRWNYMAFLYVVVAEAMFFFGVFWAFCWNMYSGCHILNMNWQHYMNPCSIPLTNTFILLASSTSLETFLYLTSMRLFSSQLFLIISLGVIFVCLQAFEYKWSSYSLQYNMLYTGFYTLTGFHGFHVIAGLGFWFVYVTWYWSCYNVHTYFLQSGSLYWHFVDIIWLIVLCLVYIGLYQSAS